MVGLFLWLKRPPEPAFVIIGADPSADAGQLDAPFDLFGWQAGRRFIDLGQRLTSGQEGYLWGSRSPSVVANAENPMVLPSDPDGLAEWANELKAYDPIVIYVGTHCGSTPADGPVIFTGNDKTLPVKTLIETLASEPLTKKKKLLLFDPGRMGPNVLMGQLTDDFAWQMHNLNDQVAACPNLVVITGSDSGQRAWPGSDSSIGLGSDPKKTLLPDPEMDQVRYAQRLLDLLASGGLNADRAGFAGRLQQAAPLLQKFPASERPIEAHLQVMVERFYRDVLAKPTPADEVWAVAVATRQRAEWAALGMDRNSNNSTYVERVGPIICPIIEQADKKRRSAEDKLFASDSQRSAEELLKQAWQGYDQATSIAENLRTAYEQRDRIAADLPYYMEWAIARGAVGIEPDDLRKLWQSHATLSDHLDSAKEDQASVAILADTNLKLGQVAILIDFSGSMELPEINSKKDQALAIFEELLKTLPKGTPLSVRVFSGKRGDVRINGSQRIFAERVSWQSGGNLTRLNGLIEQLRAINPYAAMPLGDSVIESIQNDFQSGGDYRELSKTLVVLTDGADQTNTEDKMNEDKSRTDRLDQFNDRIRNTIIDNSVQLNVVRISQSDDPALGKLETRLTARLFKGIDTLSTPGQVAQAKDFAQLKVRLLNAIRPKLKLTSAGVGTIPGYPRSRWPSHTLEDVEFDQRHKLYWSPLIPTGSYMATAYPTRAQTGLLLEPGDRMIDGFFPQSRGPLRICRELYAESFRNKKGRLAYRGDGHWVMTVPAITVNDIASPLSLTATTFLENVPPHARRGNRPDEAETTLHHVRSPLLWWEVVPVTLDVQNEPQPGTPPKQIVIRKRYAFPAPTWEINAIDWPRHPSSAGFQSAQIQTWVADIQPKPTIGKFQLDKVVRTTAPDGDPIEVRLSCENHAIGNDKTPISCLVARVDHSKGKPVRIRYSSNAPHHTEHRYYEKANSTTALFGPFPLSQLRGSNIELRIFSIAPLRESASKRITYISPRPTLGSQAEEEYRPQPGSVGE